MLSSAINCNFQLELILHIDLEIFGGEAEADVIIIAANLSASNAIGLDPIEKRAERSQR